MKHKPTITECLERYIRRYYGESVTLFDINMQTWLPTDYITIPRRRVTLQAIKEGVRHGEGYQRIAEKLAVMWWDLTPDQEEIRCVDAIAALELIRECHSV